VPRAKQLQVHFDCNVAPHEMPVHVYTAAHRNRRRQGDRGQVQ
jgi:hypothetical protein